MTLSAFSHNLASRLEAGISTLSIEIGVFLLLALILNRKNVTVVLTKALPPGFQVNALCYVLEIVLLTPLLGLMVLWLSQTFYWPLSPLSSFWVGAPRWSVLLGVIVAADALSYLRHRAEHSRWLWAIHSMHHSDREMSWFTLYRQHPLNRFSTVLFDVSLLMMLGFPIWALFANAWIRHYYGLLTHANLPWTFGPVGRVLVSPAMHRWHHVRAGEGVGTNFGTVFSVFDQLFGTYYMPSVCREPVGLDGVGHSSFLFQIMAPIVILRRKRFSSEVDE